MGDKYVKLNDVEKALRKRIDWCRPDITKEAIEIRNECLEVLSQLDYIEISSDLRGDNSG